MNDHPILVTEITPGVLTIFYGARRVGDIPAEALQSLMRAAHEHKQNRRTR
jgi:hypothetical protein